MPTGKHAPPTDRERSQPTSPGMPTLEEVLVAFQKGLARATLAAYNVSKADPEFARGARTLYVTEGLDVDLRAGLPGREAAPVAPAIDCDAAL